MGYRKIPNLYKPETAKAILSLEFCYAMEKIHGTSANITLGPEGLKLFSGGIQHERFKELLIGRFGDLLELEAKINKAMFLTEQLCIKATIYGELYGGKCQKMSDVYGPLNFVAFEVQLFPAGEEPKWLNVPTANYFCAMANIPFVHWERGPATLEWLDAQRDKPSMQAKLNGMGVKYGEGIVVRPTQESYRDKWGNRLLAKHKSEKYRECRTPRKPDPEKMVRWEGAQKVAGEFVVPERLNHVLDALRVSGLEANDVCHTGKVVKAMLDDIKVEEGDEIEWTPEVSKAIGAKTAKMFIGRVRSNV